MPEIRVVTLYACCQGRREALRNINVLAVAGILSPPLFFSNMKNNSPDKIDKKDIQFIAVGNGANNILSCLMKRADCHYKGLGLDSHSINSDMYDSYPKILLGENDRSRFCDEFNSEFRKSAALENSKKNISNYLSKARANFIIACLGGYTGTYTGPIVAKWSYDSGIKTIGIVTLPFNFEGKKRYKRALTGLREFKNTIEHVFIIRNQTLLLNRSSLVVDMFNDADKRIIDCCQNIVKSLIKNR